MPEDSTFFFFSASHDNSETLQTCKRSPIMSGGRDMYRTKMHVQSESACLCTASLLFHSSSHGGVGAHPSGHVSM